jgi:superfamily II RNA helicase
MNETAAPATRTETPPLLRHLPPSGGVDAESLLTGFLAYLDEAGIEPYPAQEEAFLEIFDRRHVILKTPTGSGKSLVATSMEWMAIAEGRRCFYTAPIKALVSEKFFELCRVFGADQVGMMTGDASVNPSAPVICCTAEILSNLALREGKSADVDYVVMDEFHFYSERERGVAWQIPLLTLPHVRFLLMSATLGNTDWLVESLERLTGERVATVSSATRPVPLDFEYRDLPLQNTLGELLAEERVPVYVVHFTQRAAAEKAQDLMSIDFLSKEQKQAIKHELRGFRFDTPFGKELRRWVHHGIGVHHAGMLPKYRLVIEKLAQAGQLKIICGTDTLGVGVNVPIRSVLFTQLCKYDGVKTRILTVRDFQQIAGRAGRKGYDDRGWVICQAPEHVIENQMLLGKAGDDPKKKHKIKFKKPPERGYAHWDEGTFERLRDGEPERLVSRFDVSHGMILNVLARGSRGCADLRQIIRDSHEGRAAKFRHGRTAISMIRSLLGARVLDRDSGGVFLNEDLQSDFSLNQALSLFAVEAVLTLDHEAPDYALDALTVVESILEDPGVVLAQQIEVAKTRALAAMKAEGLEYDERMAELEKVDRPKPKADVLWGLFNAFASQHPWVGAEGLRPKSVAREMYEEGASFLDYVKEYGLARSEGVLLRYLSDAYKAMVQNVPEGAKTEEIYDLCDWLGAVVRQVDSSLIDEWEKLREGDATQASQPVPSPDAPFESPDITRDEKGFTVLVRNAMWRLVQGLARHEYDRVAELVEPKRADGDVDWTPTALEEALAPYRAELGEIRTDPAARAPKHCVLERHRDVWEIRQTLLDPEDHAELFLFVDVHLAASAEEGRPVLRLRKIGD